MWYKRCDIRNVIWRDSRQEAHLREQKEDDDDDDPDDSVTQIPLKG